MNISLKKITLFFWIVFSAVFGQRSMAQNIGYKNAVNVKDFGAVGNGTTDDTYAIQSALNFASKQIKGILVNTMKGNYGGAGEAAYPMVVFPEGTYVISNTLVGYRSMFLKGQGVAVLKQTDTSKGIYYQHKGYRAIIEDLTFDGGKTQIQLWTNNQDASKLIISGCTFKNSLSEAVWCDSYKVPVAGGSFQNVGPYVVATDANGYYTITGPQDLSNAVHQYNSTIINIFECQFKNCIRVLNIDCDGAIVKDCSVETARNGAGAVMLCRGRIDFKNIQCSAGGSRNTQYWIEANTTLLSCRNSSFTSAVPMTVVKYISNPGYLGGSLIVNNCTFNNSCSTCQSSGIVSLYAFPNVFSFLENQNLSGGVEKAVIWNLPVKDSTFQSQRYFKLLPSQSQFHFMLAYNSSNIDVALPDSAMPYARTAPGLQALAEKQKANDTTFIKKSFRTFGNVVYAVDYGIKADGVTDDAAILQTVLDSAGKVPGSVVLLPPKIIKIGTTLNVPASLTIMGTGFSFLKGNGTFTAFSSAGYDTIAFKNIGFESFTRAMDLQPKTVTKNYAIVNNCNIYDCDTAIVCIAPSSTENAVLQVTNSNILSQALLKENVLVKFSNSWAQNNYLTNQQGIFENLSGGTLILESNLGVPRAVKGDIINGATWALNDSLRWIDNYGKVIVLDNRFGGESGGLCAVRNMSETATIFYQGGFDQCYDQYTQKCISYFFRAPVSAIFMDIEGIPGPNGNPTPAGRQYVWKLDPSANTPVAGSVFIGDVMIDQN